MATWAVLSQFLFGLLVPLCIGTATPCDEDGAPQYTPSHPIAVYGVVAIGCGGAHVSGRFGNSVDASCPVGFTVVATLPVWGSDIHYCAVIRLVCTHLVASRVSSVFWRTFTTFKFSNLTTK